jgi:hypothetical protein
MKENVLAGTTSYRIPIFVQNSTSATGGGLTGLTYSTSGLSCAYWRGPGFMSSACRTPRSPPAPSG